VLTAFPDRIARHRRDSRCGVGSPACEPASGPACLKDPIALGSPGGAMDRDGRNRKITPSS
jgi:hypothetical protein